MSTKKDRAIKFDDGKPPMALLPRSAKVQVARVLAHGAEKYGRDNWRNGGMEWMRLLDAAMRHIDSFVDGEDMDPDTGINHIAHAVCGLMFLLEYYEKGMGADNRWKTST